MSVPYSDVYDNDLISTEVLACIPDECEECGSEIFFTDSLNQIFCSNEYCPLKVAARLESMAKAMEADGFGESTCQEICRHFKLKSPYQVFMLEDKEFGGTSAFKKKMASICDKKKRRVKIWELVKYAGIPGIETTAYKIFDGYNSIEEAYKDIENLQVPFIANKLGLKNSSNGVMAVNIYNTLIKYRDEIMFGQKYFDIYKAEGVKMMVVITGGVMGYTNKAEFIKYINMTYSGKLNVVQMNSVSSAIDVLVVDGDTSSNKFKKATEINRKSIEAGTGNKIMILGSEEFKELIEREFGSNV